MALSARFDQAAHAPVIQKVRQATLHVRVVAGLLVGQQHAGPGRARLQRGQPVLGIHQDGAGVSGEHFRRERLELGERLIGRWAALLADLLAERAALVDRGRADDAAVVRARVDPLDLALRERWLRRDGHDVLQLHLLGAGRLHLDGRRCRKL